MVVPAGPPFMAVLEIVSTVSKKIEPRDTYNCDCDVWGRDCDSDLCGAGAALSAITGCARRGVDVAGGGFGLYGCGRDASLWRTRCTTGLASTSLLGGAHVDGLVPCQLHINCKQFVLQYLIIGSSLGVLDSSGNHRS